MNLYEMYVEMNQHNYLMRNKPVRFQVHELLPAKQLGQLYEMYLKLGGK